MGGSERARGGRRKQEGGGGPLPARDEQQEGRMKDYGLTDGRTDWMDGHMETYTGD